MDKILGQLKQRHIFRIAGIYAVVGWLLVQVASIMLPNLGAPGWVLSTFILLIILGFPLALILTWAAELTPSAGADPGPEATMSAGMSDFAIIAMVAIIAAASIYQIMNAGQEDIITKSGLVVSGIERRAAIAVLPFTNASADEEQDYFADGITVDIISRLQSLRLFPIISQNSSFTFRGASADVRKVGEDLGVKYIVEGTVQRAGERLRVTAQLIAVDTGFSLWSETYDRNTGDLFDLQDDITQSIASALAPEIKRSEILKARAKPTDDLDAYDLYLKGIRLSRAEEFSDVLAAQENLLEAVRLDPEFAPPLVELGWIEHDLITYYSDETTYERSKQARDQALEYGERAVSLDPQLAEAHSVFGHMLLHFGRLEQGLAALAHALALNPSSASIRTNYSWALILNGRQEEGLEEMTVSRRLNPNDPLVWEIYSNSAYAYLDMGRYQEAITNANSSLLLNPENPYSFMILVSGYHRDGRQEEALLAMENLKRVAPNFSIRTLDLTSFSATQIAGFRTDFAALGWSDPS